MVAVVGVAGRVVFVQMRGELDDVEAKVRRDLAAASADLRGQLMLALRDFEVFRTGIFQASSEAIRMAAEQSQDAINKISAAGAQSIGDAVKDGERQAQLMTQMLTRINQALGELPTMTKLELPSERLEKQFATLTAELETIIGHLEAVVALVRQRSGAQRRRWYFLYLR